MTLLVWLAASSLVWGGALWGAAIALQSGNDLSGRVRQWIWRGAGVLLIMPWLAVPVVSALAPDLSGSIVAPVMVSEEPASLEKLAPFEEPAAAAVDVASVQPVVVVKQGIAIPWIEIIFAVVIGGWLLRGFVAGRAARHLGRIIADSRPGEGASLATLARWSRTLGLRRAPELRVVSASTSPFSTGVAKPLVCLPEGIEQNMHAQTLDLIVGHECIHVARGDGWRRPLERSIADFMWFNPFAWAIRRELDLARELACDEAVIAASSQRKAYARTLRVVAGLASALPASAPAASMSLSGSGRLLAMRVKRALDAAGRKPAKAAIAGAVMLAFAATPMAIAQAILIEAAQPPDAPAPPAPPAPPATASPVVAPTPPAPPVPPSPADAVAPVAPVASPSPVSAVNPVATPSPPHPRAVPRAAPSAVPTPRVTPTPETPVTPRTGVTPVTPTTPSVTPTPPVAPALERIVLRAPFVARVLDVRTLQDGVSAVTLQQVASRASPLNGEPCVAYYANVKNPRIVASRAAIQEGTIIGFGLINEQGNAMTCSAAGPTPIRQVPQASTPTTLTPIQFASGKTASILEGSARRTSAFGYRTDPFANTTVFHPGIDLAQKLDSPVRSPADAIVTFAGTRAEYGRMVELAVDGGVVLRLGHLNRIDVVQGEQVEPGQVIGGMGNTGQGTGAHLHLEALKDGTHVDPEMVEGLILFGG